MPSEEELNKYRQWGFLHVDVNIKNQINVTIPPGYVAMTSRGQFAKQALMQQLREIGVPCSLWFTTANDESSAVYAMGADITLEGLRGVLGSEIEVSGEGARIQVPSGDWFEKSDISIDHLDEINELNTLNNYLDEVDDESTGPLPIVGDNPLAEYSVRGQAEDLAAMAMAMAVLPLLGWAVLLGQMTLIYGTPNVGKTLIVLALLLQAIKDGRLEGANLYYINADDSSQGVADKVRLLDAAGAHTLLPGHNGFDMGKLESLLLLAVAEEKCRGVVIVVDTLKKAIDIMSKSDSTRLAKAVRAFVQAGGTFIALAHTNKHPGPNGKLTYAGTADFHQDADACLYLKHVGETPSRDEVLVQFEVFKQRGPNRAEAYAYLSDRDVPYIERLDSVRSVNDDEERDALQHASRSADAEVIAGIREAIEDGNVKKMDLERAVRAAFGIPRSRFSEVLEKYDGALWSHQVRERGAKVYRLLD